MAGLFRRSKPTPPTIVERVEPVEVPVLTEAKRRIAQGDVAGAVLYSYPRAVADLARAYNVGASPDRTHEEILANAANSETGHLPEFLNRLFALYQPLRYAGPTQVLDGEVVFGLLQSIYSVRPMWQLYIVSKIPPVEPSPTPSASATGAPTRSLAGGSS